MAYLTTVARHRWLPDMMQRYADTDAYIRERLAGGESPERMKNVFERDQQVLRFAALPVSAVTLVSCYAYALARQGKDDAEYAKFVGHLTKGYLAALIGEVTMRWRGASSGVAHGSGMAASLLSALAFEGVQEWSEHLPGAFSGSDIAADMAGGALAVSLEAYFDRKIGLVDAISHERGNSEEPCSR